MEETRVSISFIWREKYVLLRNITWEEAYDDKHKLFRGSKKIYKTTIILENSLQDDESNDLWTKIIIVFRKIHTQSCDLNFGLKWCVEDAIHLQDFLNIQRMIGCLSNFAKTIYVENATF